MYLQFNKFHGTGNDFIIVDDSSPLFDATGKKGQETIARLCSRHTGIGADGLIILRKDPEYDFFMQYFNSDGREGSLCGNGSRCAVAYAFMNAYAGSSDTEFRAADGVHTARIEKTENGEYLVSVTLNDAALPERLGEGKYFVNTGSPHLVLFGAGGDVYSEGKKIRHSSEWQPEGVNVNFARVESTDNLWVDTFERGVENVTLSCGTGVTAAAIAAFSHQRMRAGKAIYRVDTKGGGLIVSYNIPDREKGPVKDIVLQGPAVFVFRGEVKI